MKIRECWNVSEWLNPWWTIKLLKEHCDNLQDQVVHTKLHAAFWECEVLKYCRDQRGMGTGIRRLVEKNKQLKRDLVIAKNVERTLRNKLGEE